MTNWEANVRRDPAYVSGAPGDGPLAFHRALPGYAATPLRDLPALAARARVGRVLAKDESDRFGLPAFKMLGASWATYRALSERLGAAPADWSTLDELADRFAPLRPLELVTATDGNHGRAVARMAAWLGFGARIFVPRGTSAARIEGIEGEGASCTVVDGTYDQAVAIAAASAGPASVVVSDTAWEGYDEVPRWVIEGYATIFAEIDDQLAADSWPAPDVVLVPIGVGALAAAAAGWYRRAGLAARPRLMGIEPTSADCMRASVRAGRLVTVPGPHDSIMAGLNCGEASPIAFPVVTAAFDDFAAVDDEVAEAGMRALADEGMVTGESGACTAGLLLCDDLGLPSDAVVLLLCTEGATDPAKWEQVVGEAAVVKLSNLDPAFRSHLLPVARTGDVTEHPMRVELLGDAVVLVRPAGGGTEVVAFPDRCPHRYARLSDGCIIDGELQCPYHGWRYRADGSCSLIPASGPGSSAADLVRLERLAVTEAFGLVFVALDGAGSALLDVPEWEHPDLTPAWLPRAVTRAGAGQFLDNFLDIAHFPFVHAGTFGAAEDERIGDLDIERGDGTLRVRYEHVVEHHEDPGVASGARPLLQPRVMEYTYRVPFGMRLRLEYPLAAIENTIIGWAVPETADRTALWFVLLRNDLATDADAKAAVDYELSVLDEDLRILDRLPEPELELDLTAQPHTKADRPTVELRRLLRALVDGP